MVLANGSLLTVTDKNKDLFWALKGAGHNFGIVTSVTSKIYDIEHANYAMETLFFTGDQVEAVYQAANDNWLTGGTQPVDLINWSYWFFDPTIDSEKVILFCKFSIFRHALTVCIACHCILHHPRRSRRCQPGIHGTILQHWAYHQLVSVRHLQRPCCMDWHLR